MLTIDDRPFFPRVVEHQGEPLSVLKQLGFNTVWLKRLPAPEILEEADKLGLWLICPSPRPVGMNGNNDPAAMLSEVGPAFDSVLMWDLGSNLTAEQLDATRRQAEQIRNADHRGARPLICQPISKLREYSRLDNNMILLIDRRPLGTSMELVDYGTWVRRQPLLARPGTPVWTTVQTQPNESLRRADSLIGSRQDIAGGSFLRADRPYGIYRGGLGQPRACCFFLPRRWMRPMPILASVHFRCNC